MNDNNQSLLEKFLNDSSFKNWAYQSDRKDCLFWENWIRNNPDEIETVYAAKSIILGVNFTKTELPEAKVNTELNAVLNTINQQQKGVVKLKKQSLSSRFITYASVAAIALIFVVVGHYKFSTATEVVHKTAYGELIDLKLPDGTSVVLNGNSEIRYDKNNPRDIRLVGEAYFKVKPIKATKAKFWVTTEDLKVEVFGTQFHVNTREEKTNVLLDEGAIQLQLANGCTQKMIPGDRVTFSKEENSLTHQKISLKTPYAVWRKGTYVFNNITLEQVMKNVATTYGLEVEFTDENLKQTLLSGGIPNQNLAICLKAIEKATGVHIEKESQKLRLSN